MSRLSELERQVRRLDPGARVADDAGSSPAAQALLRRLSSAEGETAGPQAPVARPRRRAVSRRVSRVLLPAAAVSLGLLAAGVITPDEQAYGTWTAYPTGVSGSPEGEGARWCQRWWASGATTDDAQLVPVLVEERGDHTLVVGESTVLPGGESICLAAMRDGQAAGGVGLSQNPQPRAPGPGQVTLTGYDTTSYGDATPSGGTDTATSVVTGRVGAEVSAVVVHTPQQGPVQASLVDGRWAAWWPWEMAWDDRAYPALSFELQLQDGSTVTGLDMEQVDDRVGRAGG